MDRIVVIRVAALYTPAMLVVLACVLNPPRKIEAAAALLASSWSVWSLLFVNVVATRAGWWTFAPGSGTIAGVPADVLIGWVLFWGAAPVLALRNVPLLALIVAVTALDVAIMPLGVPVVELNSRWLFGEALAIAIALVPAQLLARWTVRDRWLGTRAAMQAVSFGVLMLWVLPEVVFRYTGGSWAQFLRAWRLAGGLPLQLALLPALMGVSAVQEFAERGGGTPIPFDAPRRLVTSGPYAYVANPMQLSLALMLTAWGALIGSGWMMLAGPMAVVYGLGLAASDESHALGERFGAPWRAYRRRVRSWIPRRRPFHPSVDVAAAEPETAAPQPARLYVSATCGRCSEVAAWFSARRPRGLEIVPAEQHPSRDLWRITYDPGDNTPDEEGVVAVARALEHVHLGWAILGWIMRLPLLRSVLQLLVDASGGEPRLIERTLTPQGEAPHAEVSSCTR
jgi:protein-S-isoprenylcysteine O-methyltransferase Ste14